MPVSVRCPNPSCAQPLKLPETSSGSVRCPRCGQAFRVAPAAAATRSLPPEDTIKGPPPGAAATLDLPAGDTTNGPPAHANAAATRSLPPDGTTTPVADSAAPRVPERIGRFVVRRFLGEGAFGRVYEAHDTQLDRAVALKVAKPELLHSERRVTRFLREARAAANLRHPHIVPVFDSGSDAGHLYIASAFIPGRSLDRRLEELPDGQVLDFRESARIIRRLAEALAYAHQHKVIHRDVKPANVMLDEEGEPLLMDFGLAAREEGGEKLTQEGTKGMGTPAYMAPEQGAGEAVAASDQYSLGCTLYELLTGRTPFAGTPELQMFLHQSQEPERPRKVNPHVPLDLDTVCLKCLEKEPAKRYPDCQALADDLRRWLDGEPVTARRPGLMERAGKWARRNPIDAALALAVVVVLVIGATVATIFGIQAKLNADEANTKREEAETAQELAEGETAKANAATARAIKSAEKENRAKIEAQKSAHVADMNNALVYFDQGKTVETLKLLDRYRPRGDGMPDLRGFDWFYLLERCQGQQQTLRCNQGPVEAIALSADGKTLATLGGGIRTWDVATGQRQQTYVRDPHLASGSFSPARVLTFTPDGKSLLAGSVAWWDVASGQLQGKITSPGGNTAFVFAPDCQSFALVGSNTVGKTEVQVWKRTADAKNPDRRLPLNRSGSVEVLAWSPDGKRLAGGSQMGGNFQVWDTESWESVGSYKAAERPGQTHFLRALAFSPDSKLLAAGTEQKSTGEVFVFNADNGQRVGSFSETSGPVISLAFSPDGTTLAAGTGNPASGDRQESGVVRLWDVTQKKDRGRLLGHTGRVKALAFTANGRTLASGSGDGTVRFWNLGGDSESDILKGHRHPVDCLAFSADGKLLASGDRGEPSGPSRNADARLWDAATGKELHSFRGHAASITTVALTPDGKLLATGSKDGTIRLWDTLSGEGKQTLTAGGGVRFVQFSPDGKWLASLQSEQGEDRRLHAALWDVATGKPLTALAEPLKAVNVVGFRPDGKLLASSEFLRKVSLIDIPGKDVRVVHQWQQQAPVSGVLVSGMFSPDGTLLATIRPGQSRVRLWDTENWEERPTLSGHAGQIHSLAFSPDSKVLAVCASRPGQDRELKLWDVVTGRERPPVIGRGLDVSTIAFAPDNRTVATNADRYAIRLWRGARTDDVFIPNTTTEDEAPPTPPVDQPIVEDQPPFKGHKERIKSVAFSPDGQRIVSGSWDRTVRVWDAKTGKQIAATKEYTGPVHAVAFSPDGQRIVSADGDNFKPNDLKVWDAQSGQLLLTLKGHTGRVYCVAFSPDGKRIASGGEGGELNRAGEAKIWDAQTGKEELSFKEHRLEVRCLAFSRDGTRIATAGREREMKVWDPQTGKRSLNLQAQGEVDSVAFSSDGQRFAAGNGHTLTTWETATGRRGPLFRGKLGEGHGGPVIALFFSADGQRIVTGSTDHTVRVWDLKGGLLRTIKAPAQAGYIQSMAFSPDGKRIVTGSGDHGVPGNLTVWDESPGVD